MRKIISRALVPGLLLAWLLPVQAQQISYTDPGGLTLGLGLGSSRQASDIENSKGGGFDFRLGTPIYQKENAFIAIDWRFRFLAGYNQAYDHRINADGSYSNVRLDHFNYDLELAFTLNRLRERTRIILGAFAGAGITHGRVSSDLLDASGNPYDYSSINPNRDPSEILADLDQLTDKDFETRVHNRAAFLPTAGIYLGYAFTPRIALGLEHKMNFSLTEHNSFFGMDMDNRVSEGSSPDWNNYTSVVFHWTLGGRSRGKGGAAEPEAGPGPAVKAFPPQVDIVTPSTDPYETAESSVKVTARVFNITRREDISVRLNGQSQDFMFYNSINSVETTASLQKGDNSLVITCRNEAGSDSDDIILRQGTPSTPTVRNPPELAFINPPSRIQVEQDRYQVRIRSSHIAAKEDITLTVNGRRVYDFDLGNNGIIGLDLDLNEGLNEISVSGRNADGTVTKNTSITYARALEGIPPEVRILRPAGPRSVHEASRAEVLAEISHVDSYRDISFQVNGSPSNAFTFDGTSGRFRADIPLSTGTTQLNITARNAYGSDSDSRTLVWQARACPEPLISFFVSESGNNPLSGTVQHVQNMGDIRLTVNGRNNNSWRFNPSTGEIRANLYLDPGTHSVEITATNACGSVSESRTLVIETPVEAPCALPVVNMYVRELAADNATHFVSALIQNVSLRENVSILVDGTRLTGFQFDPSTGQLGARLNLGPGSHYVVLHGSNDCGSRSASETLVIKPPVEAPCELPSVNLYVRELSSGDYTHRVEASLQKVISRDQITLTVNRTRMTGFQYNPSTGQLSAYLNLDPGSYQVVVTGSNDCGSRSASETLVIEAPVEAPCIPPTVSMTIQETTAENATHYVSAVIRNVQIKETIVFLVDRTPLTDFRYDPENGQFAADLTLQPGTHTIGIIVNNECGRDEETQQVAVPEPGTGAGDETGQDAGWVRINPGNASWEFCLQTVRGTFNREDLSNSGFSYSGTASSLYFKPIAGGGTALVNGNPYTLNSGQYYLFQGNLKVQVTNQREGAMGHWSVYIESGSAPVTGKGNNRPESPCAEGDQNAGQDKSTGKDKNAGKDKSTGQDKKAGKEQSSGQDKSTGKDQDSGQDKKTGKGQASGQDKNAVKVRNAVKDKSKK